MKFQKILLPIAYILNFIANNPLVSNNQSKRSNGLVSANSNPFFHNNATKFMSSLEKGFTGNSEGKPDSYKRIKKKFKNYTESKEPDWYKKIFSDQTEAQGTNNIKLPDSFDDIEFKEFITGNGIVKVSTFKSSEDVVVKIKSASGETYNVLLKDNLASKIKRIGTAFKPQTSEVLISYPVKQISQSAKSQHTPIGIKIIKYNSKTGIEIGSTVITMGEIKSCIKVEYSDKCLFQGSLTESELDKYGITEESGIISYYNDYLVVIAKLKATISELVATLQIMVNDKGEISAIGTIYDNEKKILKNADLMTIINGKDSGDFDKSSIPDIDNSSIFAIHRNDKGKLELIKSEITRYEQNNKTFLYGACFRGEIVDCRHNVARFTCAEKVQAYYMTSYADNVIMIWAEIRKNNTISINTYTLNSISKINKDSDYKIITGKQEVLQDIKVGGIKKLHVSYDTKNEGVLYISAIDSNNNLHCQKCNIVDARIETNYTARIISNMTPKVFFSSSVKYLCDYGVPTIPTTTKSSSTHKMVTIQNTEPTLTKTKSAVTPAEKTTNSLSVTSTFNLTRSKFSSSTIQATKTRPKVTTKKKTNMLVSAKETKVIIVSAVVLGTLLILCVCCLICYQRWKNSNSIKEFFSSRLRRRARCHGQYIWESPESGREEVSLEMRDNLYYQYDLVSGISAENVSSEIESLERCCPPTIGRN